MLNINKYFKEHDPIWFSVTYCLVMIIFVIRLITVYLSSSTIGDYMGIFTWFFILGPVLLTVFHVRNYKKTISSMPRLLSLYLQIIMMFGCIHFYGAASHIGDQLMVAMAPLNENDSIEVRTNLINEFRETYEPSINGLSSEWVLMLIAKEASADEIFKEAMISFYNGMHFSLITSSTVGYGDMYPKSLSAKITVDIQVLVSFFLIAFGAGSFFAEKR